jgi:hypothetical protein
MKRLLYCVVSIACVAMAGCGSGANKDGSGGNGGGGGGAGGVDGGACSVSAACGGNLVGTWKIVSACGSIESNACPPSQSIRVETSWVQATYTFAGDGTLTFTATGTTTEAIRYPVGCLLPVVDAGVTEACTAFQDLIRTAAQQADAGAPITSIVSFDCLMDGNGVCLCNEVLTAPPQTQTGSYTTNGDQLTFTDLGADAGTSGASNVYGDYCVSGNALTIHLIDASGARSDFLMTLTRVN